MRFHPLLLIPPLLAACATALGQFPSPGHEPQIQPMRSSHAGAPASQAGAAQTASPVANATPVAVSPPPSRPSAPNQATAPSAGSPPLATRQTVFTIPFDIRLPSDPNQRPVEVQLHVSADRGASWQLYRRQAPGVGNFEFRAPRDGEYWFASRTIDAYRRAHPAGQIQPELRVLVDTTPPTLELNALVGDAGQVLTSWSVADDHLVPTSLQIHYQGGPTEPWKEVAVKQPPPGTPLGTLQNQITWWPDTAGREVNIRAEVYDRAGNSTVVHRRLNLPRIAANAPAQNLPTGGEGSRGGPANPLANQQQSPIAWPADQQADAPLGQHHSFGIQPQLGASDASTQQLAADGNYPPQPAPVNPSFAGQFSGDGGSPTPSVRSIACRLPPGAPIRMTQAAHFELDYDLEAIGPSGVAKVELFGTEDAGQTWKSWGLDDDNRSPLDIEVPRDGVYGFRIVITAGNGLASAPPKPGDDAEIWIGVDREAPSARITSAIYGRGNHIGELDILWEADDEKLLPRGPITLLYSATAGGPWKTIAAELPHNGRYSWQVDGSVPQQIYLRLEVRDEAGNLATHELTEPIANDGLVPRGAIRGIRPTPTETPATSAFRFPWFR